MPIRPENRARYPKDWKLRSRFVREVRAGRRCEWCGIPDHAVGYRDVDGSFVPLAGNGPCDAAGQGLSYPSLKPLTHEEAREFTELYNCCVGDDGRACDDEGVRWIVIVLTVAHVHDDRPEACSLLNLAALCQRCHNRHDAKGRRRGRLERAAAGGLFDQPADVVRSAPAAASQPVEAR